MTGNENNKSQREKELRNQYIYEKSLIEQYGYSSITTFEEWLEIKNCKSISVAIFATMSKN